MYALYSKNFAKKAADLSKKEFREDTLKLTAKAKSAESVEFEGNVSQKDNATDVTFTVPVDNDLKMKLKVSGKKPDDKKYSSDKEVSLEYKFDANTLTKLKLKNPQLQDRNPGEVTLNVEYTTEAFSVEAEGSYKENSSGVCAGLAFDCPGVDAVSIGLRPAYNFSKNVTNLECGLGYQTKTCQLAMTTGFANMLGTKLEENSADKNCLNTGLKFSTWMKATDAMQLGAVVQTKPEAVAGKAGYDLAKSGDEATGSFQIAAEYKFNPSTTGKLKVTSSDKYAIDLALKTALEGKITSTISLQCKQDKACEFGIAATLE